MKYKSIILVTGLFIAAPTFAAEEVNAQAADQQQSAAPAAPSTTGTIARAAFTTAVENRDHNQIYYFTELKDMEGEQVTHRWEYNGKVMAEVPFQVGGPRWRVFSSKNLDSDWKGEWKVSVIDSHGGTLGVNTFSYENQSPAKTASDNAEPAAAPAQ
jgi:hypothetical protein